LLRKQIYSILPWLCLRCSPYNGDQSEEVSEVALN